MPVQDDERERELVRMFNLSWDPAHQRAGVDALLNLSVDGKNFQFEVEVKSSTNSTVSTARDVGIEHIKRWRQMLFVIGFYSKEARRPELKHCLCLTPLDMEPWIASIETKILVDFRLAVRAAKRLDLEDLYEVCGEQDSYSVDSAKKLHKQQWTAGEYAAALDVETNGKPMISKGNMLSILQLRSQYIAERGATLNNPHIPKSYLKTFLDTDRFIEGPNWADGVRKIAIDFIRKYPDHSSIKIV